MINILFVVIVTMVLVYWIDNSNWGKTKIRYKGTKTVWQDEKNPKHLIVEIDGELYRSRNGVITKFEGAGKEVKQ